MYTSRSNRKSETFKSRWSQIARNSQSCHGMGSPSVIAQNDKICSFLNIGKLNILGVSVRDDAAQRYSFDGMLAAACAAVHI